MTDTGIGIKPEDMDTLFQPFRQIDTGITRQHEGTGLGLSICKRLVETAGWKDLGRERVGRGSTFTFTLPVDKEATMKAKILIIEDNEKNLYLDDVHPGKEWL